MSNSSSSGPPLRATAMVLIALAITFAGVGALSLSGSDSESGDAAASTTTTTTAARSTTSVLTSTVGAPLSAAASTTSGASKTSTTTTTTTSAGATTSVSTAHLDLDMAVRVLNNSTVAGLAGKTANTLKAKGWRNVSSGNHSGGTVDKTTVYYHPEFADEKADAEAIAAQLGATAKPRTPDLQGSAPGVIVIVTAP